MEKNIEYKQYIETNKKEEFFVYFIHYLAIFTAIITFFLFFLIEDTGRLLINALIFVACLKLCFEKHIYFTNKEDEAYKKALSIMKIEEEKKHLEKKKNDAKLKIILSKKNNEQLKKLQTSINLSKDIRNKIKKIPIDF